MRVFQKIELKGKLIWVHMLCTIFLMLCKRFSFIYVVIIQVLYIAMSIYATYTGKKYNVGNI